MGTVLVMALDPNLYLESSTEAIDGGQKIGRRPRAVLKPDLLALRDLGTPTSPLRALRARCMHCCGFEKEEVRILAVRQGVRTRS